MKALSDQDSRKLFNKRIFGSEDDCPPRFAGVSCEILNKCSGLPLAIITVASILACRPTRLEEEWEHIKDCLAAQAPTISSLKDMMYVLDLSYKFLPRHLEACFLYLGTYPEDYEIDKDDVVRKWVAEGFVSGPTRRGPWDVAERYLNELVNRSMIQVTYHGDAIKKSYYKVHDMMLDLILMRCRETNFVSLVHDPQAMEGLQVKVRRLTVQLGGTKDDTGAGVISSHLSQLRSLSIFRANYVPPLSELRFLRVLYLLTRFSTHVDTADRTCVIPQLPHLRYLHVEEEIEEFRPCTVVLPNQIGSMQHLETLELHDIQVLSIPPDIVHLPCLSHLSIVTTDTEMLPDGIGKLKSLRTLSHFRLPADSSDTIIEGLGELTKLTELSLDCHVEDSTRVCIPMTAWSTSLGKLRNLRSLRVDSLTFPCCCADALSNWDSPPFPFLEVLDVQWWTFPRVPRWMGSLNSLLELRFTVNGVSRSRWDDVGILGMLPNLITLDLRIKGNVPPKWIVIGGSTGFKLLEEFCLLVHSTLHPVFKAGAMPKLREMELIVDIKRCKRGPAMPIGLEHLASLKQIQLCGSKSFRKALPRGARLRFEAFRSSFEEAVKGLPSQPAFVRGSSNIRVYR
ncbi:unnamed protein product [Urochloa humidicola]